MIHRMRIQNFRSLRDVQVSLDPITVLIGRSGTGKTNFVDAIRFLRQYLVRRNDQFVHERGGWARDLFAAANNKTVSFEIEFGVEGVSGRFLYRLVLNTAHGSGQLVEEQLSLGDRTLFHHRDNKWLVAPQVVAPPQPGSLALGILYGIPEAKLAHLSLTRGIGCYEFPGTVLTAGSAPSPQRTGLADRAEDFLAAYEAITSDLTALSNEQEIYAALRRLNPSITSVEQTVDRARLVVGHHVADGKVLSFDLSQESAGFRRFLAHLIAIYQLPPRQTLVFEEPENGIFPGALQVLAEQFQNCADRGHSQVILTTHSPQLLGHFAPQNIRVVELSGYETRIGSIAREQLDALRDAMLTTEELLTVDPARLDPMPQPT